MVCANMCALDNSNRIEVLGLYNMLPPSPLHVDLNVTITIQYSPPSGVTLRPPNYRPATSVSLRCDATGNTGSVTYQWSSTCGSGCFISGSSQTVSRSYLFSYDAGNHSCVVTDGAGNIGTATTEMNIIGKHQNCSMVSRRCVYCY